MSDTEKSASSNNKFLKGTLILTVSSIVVKVIGSLNWIILSRVLGGEGIGLYQMGFPIYLMAITLSSAGIPVAISIITAEKLAQKDFLGAKRVFNVSLRLLFVTGLVFASALFFGAHWLIDNHWIRDSRAYYSIIALAPAVFFVTFLASFRGYLQGWQIMTPTAASEIVEQLMRVVTMIVFANMFMPHGLAYAGWAAPVWRRSRRLLRAFGFDVVLWTAQAEAESGSAAAESTGYERVGAGHHQPPAAAGAACFHVQPDAAGCGEP